MPASRSSSPLLLWTYLGWLILLAGAQLAFYVQNPNYLRLGHDALRLSHSEQERLALDVMMRVGQAHHAGAAPWTRRLAEPRARRCRASPSPTSSRTSNCRASSLQTDEDQLFPARDISGIRLDQIVDSARAARSSGRVPHARVSAPAVRQLQEAMETHGARPVASGRCADLVARPRPKRPRRRLVAGDGDFVDQHRPGADRAVRIDVGADRPHAAQHRPQVAGDRDFVHRDRRSRRPRPRSRTRRASSRRSRR